MPEPHALTPSGRPGPYPLRTFFLSLFVSAFGLAILLVGDRGTAESQRAKEESRSLSTKIATLAAENAELQKRINNAERNEFEVEKNAREKLGLVKPGDVVFVLTEPKTSR